MPAINFEKRTYNIEPSFKIICEIEDELGAIPQLADKFLRDKWAITELVTLIHIILNAMGKNIDYIELGNKILNDGLDAYLKFATQFLHATIYK